MVETFLIENEATVRLTIFCTVLALMAGWELLSPKRAAKFSKFSRWCNNILLVVSNTLALRVLFPTAAIGMAILAGEKSWGLFNSLALPSWLEIFAAIVLLDLIIYWQHRLFHRIPWLWQLHQVHHADLDYDVTTAVRFHPIEIVISMAIKMASVAILGVPLLAVILFEIILNACAMFNHGNVALPGKLDNLLRKLIVTPDMHRVHHSTDFKESNSNYGFCLSIWDRLFQSYLPNTQLGQLQMHIGLDYVNQPKQAIPVLSLLAMPFTTKPNKIEPRQTL